ncbi:hypothetical protein [Nonomuraea dietziae]
MLTDALDDLIDAGDRIERLAVAGFILNTAADLKDRTACRHVPRT